MCHCQLDLCCNYFINPYVDKQFDFLVWIQEKSENHVSRNCVPQCPISVFGMSLKDNARVGGFTAVTLRNCDLCCSHILGPDVRRMIVEHCWNDN